MRSVLSRYPDRYEIPLQPRSVSRVYVDSGFDLQFFDDAGQTGVRIDNPIAVVTENPRSVTRKDILEDNVLGKIVVSSTALRKGKVLQVVFASGVRFWVEPHVEADSGGPYRIQGKVVVCLPGTEMAIWFGRPRTPSIASLPDLAAESSPSSSAIIE